MPSDTPSSSTEDNGRSGTVRLTYKELGARLGITADSARLKARNRWRVDIGNDGKAVVTVPLADLAPRNTAEPSPEASPALARPTPEHHPEPTPLSSELLALIDDLRIEAREARQALAEAQIEAAAATARAEERQARIEDLKAQLERERERADRGLLAMLRRLWPRP